MPHRNIDDANKRFKPRLNRSAFNDISCNWVRTIQHKNRFASFTCATQHMEERAEIGIKSHADILHIEDQYINIFQHFRSRFVDRAIQTEYWQSRPWISCISYVSAIQC